MVSIWTVKSVKIFQGRGVLKTLFLKILTEEYIRLDILPWMTELHPESDLRLFLRSSLHTTLATDICEKSLSLWFASFRPPPIKGGGLKNQTMILMIFHKYLWLVRYEGMIVETNGDHIPGAIQSLMEEYFILLSLRPLFSKIAFLSTPLPWKIFTFSIGPIETVY